MNHFFKISLLLVSLSPTFLARADHHEKGLFTDLVAPILEAKCVSCHGAEKAKGKLRLDSIEAIMKGGSEGVSVVPGKLEESSIIGRVLLPLDDDEHMPPEDKPQLTKEETEVLKFWVQSGANPTATIAELKPTPEVDAMIKSVLANPPKKEGVGNSITKLDPAQQKVVNEAMAAVEETGATLMAISLESPDLRFSALNVADEFGDKGLEILKPAASQIKWMDLAKTQVTDSGLVNLAGMKNLTRLHLQGTSVTDAGLAHLAGLTNLEYLNLYQTKVTDAGLEKLKGLKNLKKLYVWQSGVTDAGAKKIGEAIPGLAVNNGWKEPPAPKPVLVTTVAAATPAAPKTAVAEKAAATPPPAAKPAQPKAPPVSGVPALDVAIQELKTAVTETGKRADAAAKASASAAAASKTAAAAAAAAKAVEEKAVKIEADAKTALQSIENLAKLSKGYEKVLAELKTATAKATQDVAAAKKTAVDTAAAAATAAGKIPAAEAAAKEAQALAGQTKAALDILLNATKK